MAGARSSPLPGILVVTGLALILVTAAIAAGMGLRPAMGGGNGTGNMTGEDMARGSAEVTLVVLAGVILIMGGSALRWRSAGAPERQRMERELDRDIGLGEGNGGPGRVDSEE